MIEFLKNWGDLIVAIAALIVAIWSLFESKKAQKLQIRVNELEVQIKQYELDRIQKEQEENSQTLVDANIIKISSGKYRLRLSNISKQNVYDVNVSIDNKYEIIIYKKDIIPYEIIEPYHHFDLSLITHSMSAPKFELVLNWKDKDGKEYNKKIIRTLN